MTYTAIPGKGESRYGACVPDHLGCVAVGEGREESPALLKEASISISTGSWRTGRRCPVRVAASCRSRWLIDEK